MFIASLSASSLARIEEILDALAKDIREGRKSPTIVSVGEDDDDELAWGELSRELVGDGITKDDVEKHKDEIKAYLPMLVEDNTGMIEIQNEVLTISQYVPYEGLYLAAVRACQYIVHNHVSVRTYPNHTVILQAFVSDLFRNQDVYSRRKSYSSVVFEFCKRFTLFCPCSSLYP